MHVMCPGHSRYWIHILWIEVQWAWFKTLGKNLLQQIKISQEVSWSNSGKELPIGAGFIALTCGLFWKWELFKLLFTTFVFMLSIFVIYRNIYWISVDFQTSVKPWSYQLHFRHARYNSGTDSWKLAGN